VNPEKTKYMLMSRSQKIGQKHRIKIANRSFENVAKFKFVGTTVRSKNCMDEEINSRLNSGTLAAIRFRIFCSLACCLGA
jgi:hypothetical protein